MARAVSPLIIEMAVGASKVQETVLRGQQGQAGTPAITLRAAMHVHVQLAQHQLPLAAQGVPAEANPKAARSHRLRA
jgi:hypothetical protein